jgi:hypothetical protein
MVSDKPHQAAQKHYSRLLFTGISAWAAPTTARPNRRNISSFRRTAAASRRGGKSDHVPELYGDAWEKDTTRGRAHLLWEMLQGSVV